MKVVFQYQGLISESYKRRFRENLPEEVELVFMETRDEEELLKEIEDADVFVGYHLTSSLMERAKKLRHIQIPWTGFNNLGVEHLEGREDITVSNSHGNSLAIAEHAVALLCSAAKLITARDGGMRRGDWTTRYEDVNSVWLNGRTVAIIGYGSIGKKVAEMLHRGFGMKVVAVKRTAAPPDGVAEWIGDMHSVNDAVSEADFIVIATPLTRETEGIIGEEQFALMKERAVLVNIARGEVVDEEALFNALKERRIHSAGIDVWYNYPRGEQRVIHQNYPFEDLDNIVMTPHSAFKIVDREEVFISDILLNLQKLYRGEEPINRVNLELGY